MMETDECQSSCRKRKTCLSESAPVDPDNDLRDTLFQEESTDSAADESEEVIVILSKHCVDVAAMNFHD